MENSLAEFVVRYGVLIGSGAVAVVLYAVGIGIVRALDNIAASQCQLAQKIANVSESITGEAQEQRALLESLHRLFGGRQWQRDELDNDLDGPTIQSLLQSIAESLKANRPEHPEPTVRSRVITR